MGTASGPFHLPELCDQKLLEFVCNVENKDLVWLQEIEEEAVRMFTRDFNKEPELMPKTPSQKNRSKKRRISYVQDENRDPVRKRLSRKKKRSSQRLSRQLRNKDKVEKLSTAAGDSPVLRRVTRATAAAAAAAAAATTPAPIPESPTTPAQTPKPGAGLSQTVPSMPVVEIRAKDRRSAEEHLRQCQSARAPSPAPHAIESSDEETTPRRPESVAVSAMMVTPQDAKDRPPRAGRSVSKLRIAQATPVPQASPASPWQERVLLPILPDNFSSTPGTRVERRSVRRSLLAPSNQKAQVSLAEKFSLVAKQDLPVRSSSRISRKDPEEPTASARIICHSYLERLLNVEVPQKASPPQEDQEPREEPVEEPVAAPEVSKIAINTPGSRTVVGDSDTSPEGDPETTADHAKDPKELASLYFVTETTADHTKDLKELVHSARCASAKALGAHSVGLWGVAGPGSPTGWRRKRSYKHAVSDLDEEEVEEQEEEELRHPNIKTPSPLCPANKVVRPLRTFLHTVQRNQMLMTPTSASRGVKTFIKRNTSMRVDPKCSFVEKERQRLENLRRKEEAELLRRQKVEEDKRRRLEEVKLKREERLRKVLQARERVKQIKEEKKKQIEQKFAQIEEKNEKAKEERLAEEKAKKKAAARKMEEVEARRKQEEEARRLRWLQQEEERRHQELLQKKKEEERKVADAKRLAEQRELERRQEQERLQAEREQMEREKALRLQRERLQRELEEKKKKEEQQRLAERQLQEEQERKAKEAAASKALNVTVDVQSPACTSYQMTPQGPRNAPKINPDNYGMDLNSDDSTDDEAHPRKPIPGWARGTQLSQAIIHQYYHPWNLLDLFGPILPLDLEDIFKKSKPRYHKRTSSAVWNSPPLHGPRVPGSLAYSLKKY
ncbi:inner centromere protein [Suncus etruscus]|uniref:inner centromere protein n=1 Tax=Suncus etruscus TaxID=109475 RepID=UPI002110A4F8|nr:inner centromere protein [Suncus etruscus]